eukprot:363455-Chlamydomonas_euryale.AAC.4
MSRFLSMNQNGRERWAGGLRALSRGKGDLCGEHMAQSEAAVAAVLGWAFSITRQCQCCANFSHAHMHAYAWERRRLRPVRPSRLSRRRWSCTTRTSLTCRTNRAAAPIPPGAGARMPKTRASSCRSAPAPMAASCPRSSASTRSNVGGRVYPRVVEGAHILLQACLRLDKEWQGGRNGGNGQGCGACKEGLQAEVARGCGWRCKERWGRRCEDVRPSERGGGSRAAPRVACKLRCERSFELRGGAWQHEASRGMHDGVRMSMRSCMHACMHACMQA